jgi:glycosyltransferase involved in cell wall biosynthesis
MRMRVLYLIGKIPLPLTSGDAHRNWALLQATRRVATTLDLVALSQPPGDGTAEGLAEVARICDALTITGRPPGELLGAPRNRLRTLAGRPYYRSIGDDPAVRAAVDARLKSAPPDVIVLSQPFFGSAIPERWLDRVVYDSHNVHHLRFAESLSGMRRLPRRLRDRMIHDVLTEEARLVAKVARCLACSELDATAFREMSPAGRIEVVPNGVDVADEIGTPGTGAPLFLASLDATANIEGLAYLIDEVLPCLPDSVSIDVAGSNARPEVIEIVERARGRARFLGQVPDARSAMRNAAALLIPLHSGGGTRLKALEAFGVGAPVISTTKGVEGIPIDPGRHALVADTPTEFAAAVARVIEDRDEAARLACEARKLVEADFSWPHIGERFTQVLHEVAANGGSRPSE